MLLTIALVVLSAAFVALFMGELQNLGKKFVSNEAFKLFFPLLFASCFIEFFDTWVRLLVFWIQTLVHRFFTLLTHYLPFGPWNLKIIHIAAIYLCAILPLWYKELWERRTGQRKLPQFFYRLSFTLWGLSSIFFLLPIR